ncbi:hypothetical protein pb186bvf_020583 [Paramecium bursaria]
MTKQVGKYEFIHQIGNGAFATVYKAKNLETQEIVAIKEIDLNSSSIITSPNILKSLEREIEIHKKLNHPNILPLIDVILETRYWYIVLKYCEKGDLRKFIKENSKDGKFNEQEAQILFSQLVDAYQYMFKNSVIHRDLKLDNILIDSDQNIMIADFGFARIQNEGLFKSVCGSPITMAPEILISLWDGSKDSQLYDAKCDIWSLGIILYHLLVGKYPFLPKEQTYEALYKLLQTQPVYPDYLSESVKNILQGMLTFSPKDRIEFEELFNHPWIIKNNSNGSLCRQLLQSISLPRIQYSREQKIGKIISNQVKSRTEIFRIIEQLNSSQFNEHLQRSTKRILSLLQGTIFVSIQYKQMKKSVDLEFDLISYQKDIGYWINNAFLHYQEQQKVSQVQDLFNQLWTKVKSLNSSNHLQIILLQGKEDENYLDDIRSQILEYSTQNLQIDTQLQDQTFQIEFQKENIDTVVKEHLEQVCETLNSMKYLNDY